MNRTLSTLTLAALLSGCAPIELAEGCSTDTECMDQCIAELRPDEDPGVCEISLAPLPEVTPPQ